MQTGVNATKSRGGALKFLTVLCAAAVFIPACDTSSGEAGRGSGSGSGDDGRIECTTDFFGDHVRYIDTLVSHSGEVTGDFTADKAFGPPQGGGEVSGSLDVFVVGEEEEAVFSAGGFAITDGEGIDFKIFENGFYVDGNPDNNFWDLARVEVSPDGEVWTAFPVTWQDGTAGFTTVNRLGKDGLVGLTPAYANCTNPSDEGLDLSSEAAGGDGFDLADIGLDEIRYIKIIDTGELYDGVDSVISNGVDIDAVVIFSFAAD